MQNIKKTDKPILKSCVANGWTEGRTDEQSQVDRAFPLAWVSKNKFLIGEIKIS